MLEYIFSCIGFVGVDFEGYDDVFECESESAVQEIENIAAQVREYWGIRTGPIKICNKGIIVGRLIVTALLTQISWTNHLAILSKAKTMEERHFYITLCIKESYSSRELERQMESVYYERYILSKEKVLPEPVKGLKENLFLDTYVIEFLDMPPIYKEQDFKKALIQNMKDFILELGKDFTFIDEEYKVQVGGEDFAIDLLFFHRGLQCLVAFELKIGKFKPEYISKMDFYLEALDRQKKKEHENPSVGLILCASKNDEVVEYAMSRSMSPMLVSEYKLQLPDKKILERKLQELVNTSEINEK